MSGARTCLLFENRLQFIHTVYFETFSTVIDKASRRYFFCRQMIQQHADQLKEGEGRLLFYLIGMLLIKAFRIGINIFRTN